MLVSRDINSANHNYPTNYNEAIYVAGAFPDTAPNETCSGPGGLPGLGDVSTPPEEFADGLRGAARRARRGQRLLGARPPPSCISPTTQPITTSFFRNSNLTQYGGKADIVLMGSTGSENTGQSSGAAGLLASFGRETFGAGNPLSGNEIRQLLTMTAEDVLPANTGSIGQPDKAAPGWDPHFGYGRVNLAAAMKRIARRPRPARGAARRARLVHAGQRRPPSGRRPQRRGPRRGPARRRRRRLGGRVRLRAGRPRLRPSRRCPAMSGSGPVDGALGTIPKALLTDLAANCNGEVANDAGRPAGQNTDGAWPADPYPNPDPERHAFQIRLTVHEAGDAANIGRYRKTLFAYADDGNLAGWPRPVGSGSRRRPATSPAPAARPRRASSTSTATTRST